MNSRFTRWLFNLYPPYIGAGVRVTYIAPDWRRLRVEMPLSWYNRNYFGTHFGGSLYAMSDPFLAIMAIKNLGPGFIVWDKSAEIEFVAPGRGRVGVEFVLTEADLERMRSETASGGKYLAWFGVEVKARDGTLVARVRKQLYVRQKREEAPGL